MVQADFAATRKHPEPSVVVRNYGYFPFVSDIFDLICSVQLYLNKKGFTNDEKSQIFEVVNLKILSILASGKISNPWSFLLIIFSRFSSTNR